MAEKFVGSVDITERDYVRESVEELRISLAKRTLDTHFRNAPVDDGQLVVLTIREAFKKGDKEKREPLYFGTLDLPKTNLVLPTGEEFKYARPESGDVYLGYNLSVKKDKRAVFVVRRNGNKGLKGELSTMTVTTANQMDKAIFFSTCETVLCNLDFSQVKCGTDITLCGHVVLRSQIFSNANRKNLHIDFATQFNGSEEELCAALGLSNAQAFIVKKSAVVMWEV